MSDGTPADETDEGDRPEDGAADDRPLDGLAASVGDGAGSGSDWPAGADDDEPDGRDGGPDAGEAGERREGPLGDLAASVGERRNRDAEVRDGVFTEEDVPEIDVDAVWQQLEAEDAAVDPTPDERESNVVEKGSYCESCPYFEAPPAVACSHDGTEIVELVDMERFRVVNCPKVRENERLERL